MTVDFLKDVALSVAQKQRLETVMKMNQQEDWSRLDGAFERFPLRCCLIERLRTSNTPQ